METLEQELIKLKSEADALDEGLIELENEVDSLERKLRTCSDKEQKEHLQDLLQVNEYKAGDFAVRLNNLNRKIYLLQKQIDETKRNV